MKAPLCVAKTPSAARLLSPHGSVDAVVDVALGAYRGVERSLRAGESTGSGAGEHRAPPPDSRCASGSQG